MRSLSSLKIIQSSESIIAKEYLTRFANYCGTLSNSFLNEEMRLTQLDALLLQMHGFYTLEQSSPNGSAKTFEHLRKAARNIEKAERFNLKAHFDQSMIQVKEILTGKGLNLIGLLDFKDPSLEVQQEIVEKARQVAQHLPFLRIAAPTIGKLKEDSEDAIQSVAQMQDLLRGAQALLEKPPEGLESPPFRLDPRVFDTSETPRIDYQSLIPKVYDKPDIGASSRSATPPATAKTLPARAPTATPPKPRESIADLRKHVSQLTDKMTNKFYTEAQELLIPLLADEINPERDLFQPIFSEYEKQLTVEEKYNITQALFFLNQSTTTQNNLSELSGGSSKVEFVKNLQIELSPEDADLKTGLLSRAQAATYRTPDSFVDGLKQLNAKLETLHEATTASSSTDVTGTLALDYALHLYNLESALVNLIKRSEHPKHPLNGVKKEEWQKALDFSKHYLNQTVLNTRLDQEIISQKDDVAFTQRILDVLKTDFVQVETRDQESQEAHQFLIKNDCMKYLVETSGEKEARLFKEALARLHKTADNIPQLNAKPADLDELRHSEALVHLLQLLEDIVAMERGPKELQPSEGGEIEAAMQRAQSAIKGAFEKQLVNATSLLQREVSVSYKKRDSWHGDNLLTVATKGFNADQEDNQSFKEPIKVFNLVRPLMDCAILLTAVQKASSPLGFENLLNQKSPVSAEGRTNTEVVNLLRATLSLNPIQALLLSPPEQGGIINSIRSFGGSLRRKAAASPYANKYTTYENVFSRDPSECKRWLAQKIDLEKLKQLKAIKDLSTRDHYQSASPTQLLSELAALIGLIPERTEDYLKEIVSRMLYLMKYHRVNDTLTIHGYNKEALPIRIETNVPTFLKEIAEHLTGATSQPPEAADFYIEKYKKQFNENLPKEIFLFADVSVVPTDARPASNEMYPELLSDSSSDFSTTATSSSSDSDGSIVEVAPPANGRAESTTDERRLDKSARGADNDDSALPPPVPTASPATVAPSAAAPTDDGSASSADDEPDKPATLCQRSANDDDDLPPPPATLPNSSSSSPALFAVPAPTADSPLPPPANPFGENPAPVTPDASANPDGAAKSPVPPELDISIFTAPTKGQDRDRSSDDSAPASPTQSS